MHTPDSQNRERNEGEGSRSAAHHYEEGVKRTIASGQVDKLAEAAKQALEGPQGEALRRAEQAGKKPLHTPNKT